MLHIWGWFVSGLLSGWQASAGLSCSGESDVTSSLFSGIPKLPRVAACGGSDPPLECLVVCVAGPLWGQKPVWAAKYGSRLRNSGSIRDNLTMAHGIWFHNGNIFSIVKSQQLPIPSLNVAGWFSCKKPKQEGALCAVQLKIPGNQASILLQEKLAKLFTLNIGLS